MSLGAKLETTLTKISREVSHHGLIFGIEVKVTWRGEMGLTIFKFSH